MRPDHTPCCLQARLLRAAFETSWPQALARKFPAAPPPNSDARCSEASAENTSRAKEQESTAASRSHLQPLLDRLTAGFAQAVPALQSRRHQSLYRAAGR